MSEALEPPVDPAVLRVIEALARVMVDRQLREEAEAAPQIAELRSTLGLQNDFPAWKQAVEALMAAFYDQVSRWPEIPLKDRIRLVTAAIGEVGPDAPSACIAARAGELAELEVVPAPARRRPKSAGRTKQRI